MALVVDASALASAALSGDTSAPLRQRLRDELIHAPHLIDAELGSVLRRHVLRGDLAADHAATVLRWAPRLIDHRYGHTGALADAAWELRQNLSFYYAIYASLAAALRVTLVTADRRLAGAPALPCRVDVVA